MWLETVNDDIDRTVTSWIWDRRKKGHNCDSVRFAILAICGHQEEQGKDKLL